MYVSLKWVEHLVGFQNLSLSIFIERLILGGFEIESIQKKRSNTILDIILDIDLTANRSDITNIKGFFSELTFLFASESIFQKPLNLKSLILSKNKQDIAVLVPLELDIEKKKSFSALLKNPNRNIRFVLQVKKILIKYLIWEKFFQINEIFYNSHFNNRLNDYYFSFSQKESNTITITESPLWIKKRLSLMNFKPINNVIDTINYILIETGQVFFVYDIFSLEMFTKTKNLDFTLDFANESQNFLLSKYETIFLKKNILTLKINNKIVSLFGFIQDYNTIITNKTSNFILQFSLYDAKQVKQISKSLGIRTEYSIKLEKQNDLNLVEQAYFRLLYLFNVQGITFKDTKFQKPKLLKIPALISEYVRRSKVKINVFYKNVNRLIGLDKTNYQLQGFEILNLLKFLNFRVYFKTDKNFLIDIPLQRQLDIQEEVDVIEEIVRGIGFNHLTGTIPLETTIGKLTKLEKFKRRLRSSFLNYGFTESVHSILSKKTFASETVLQNPLLNESCVLRVSLLKSLIEKVLVNNKAIRKNLETFEFGRIYKYLNKFFSKKEELEFISGIFGGKLFRFTWEHNSSAINWFEAKGILQNVFSQLNICITWIPATFETRTFYHPNRTTNLFIGKHFVGTFGQIHPNLVIKEGLNKQLYLFELNLEVLIQFWSSKKIIGYNSYSPYPTSYIDLTCIINKCISYNKIRETIFVFGQPLLTSIELFDFYSKPPIKKGLYSLSFKLGFSSMTKTLLNSEVNNILKVIIEGLEKNFDIEFN